MDETTSDPMDDIIRQFYADLDAGRIPDRQKILADHPELTDRIQQFIQEHDEAEQLVAKARKTGESLHPARGNSELAAQTLIAGKYELLEKIADGGMGSVWIAKQRFPIKRLVALKLIRPGHSNKNAIARFDAERQALALMDHPNIAKVFDGGLTEQGDPFFAMELVKGGKPITQFCDENRLTPRERLELFIPVCQALQHAHQKGLIHRDIKPSNILVGMYDDKPIAKVIDFGIAKALGPALTELSIVTIGGIVGTVKYMSPEQATENNLDIDTRSDVYSLGVLMYELLSGTLPFSEEKLQQAGVLEIMRMIREVDPPRLSAQSSTVTNKPDVAAYRNTEPKKLGQIFRGELDWIVMKSLEKKRTRRYDSANSLAQDIQRYLAGEPVEAVPPSTSYRLQKFVQKNRGPVIAGLLILLTLIAGIIGTGIGIVQANKARDDERLQAEAEKKAKEKAILAQQRAEEAELKEKNRVIERDAALEETTYQLSASNFLLAVAAYEVPRGIPLAHEYLAKVLPKYRNWEWYHLRRKVVGAIFTLNGHDSFVTSVIFSPDGSRIATGSNDQTAKVWDAKTGNPILNLKGHTAWVLSLAFSPDGLQIVTGSWDKTAKVWDAKSGNLILDLKGHLSHITSVAFSPDGSRIVTGSEDNTAKVWDAKSGNLILDLKGHNGHITSVAFSPDSLRIATGSWDNTAKVWDAKSGNFILDLNGHGSWVSSITFSPDGSRIVTGNGDKTAKVWDAKTGNHILDLKGHTSWISSVVCSPDGSRIVTGSEDQTAKVWDAKSGNHILDLKGHLSNVTSVAFSPDGSRIVTGSDDNTAKVWDTKFGNPNLLLKRHTSGVSSVAFSSDGSRIVTGSSDHTAKLWDSKSGNPILEFKGHTSDISSVAISSDGSRIVTGSHDQTAKVWDTKSGNLIFHLKGHTSWVKCVAISPDGSRIVTGSEDQTAKVWDAKSGNLILDLKGHLGRIYSVAFSPDGLRIATGSDDNSAKVWDTKSGNHILDLKGHVAWVSSFAFSPDGSRILVGYWDNTAKVWDAKSGNFILDLRGHTSWVSSVAFSPDGSRIVTGSDDQTAKVWDTKSGNPIFNLKGHTATVSSVAFSPDGLRIVTGSRDHSAKVWDTKSGKELPNLQASKETNPNGKEPSQVNANQATLIPLTWNAEEIEYRITHTRANYWRYREELDAALQSKNLFAADFYIERILAMPTQRTVKHYQERIYQFSNPLTIARTSFHHPKYTKLAYDQQAIAALAMTGDRLAKRLIAQEKIRAGQEKLAIPLLYETMLTRPSNSPPVEELLLAQAYHNLQQPKEALRFYKAATDWLDEPCHPVRAMSIVSHAFNPWNAIGEAIKPIENPKHNPMDWESWHECDVFRAALEKQLQK